MEISCKMAAFTVFLLLLLSTSAESAAAVSRPTYLITTPKDIRPGLNLTLGISLLAGSPPEVRVTAEIILMNATILHGEGLFQTGSFGTLTLPALPMTAGGEGYSLHVKGYVGDQIVFNNSTSLDFQRKSCLVFIQTDKSLYKPGQEVKMRIVTVFFDLKPYKASLDIHIRDPRGNLIEQWLEEQGDLGVVSQLFQLSAKPPLGDWSIQVTVNKQNHFQTFTVMEYVLPKFEVLLATSSHHSVNQNELTGTITAKYTYGKPVNGNAEVILFPLSSEDTKPAIKKSYKINGSVKFTIKTNEITQLITSFKKRYGFESSSFSLDIIVVVTESLTGISQNTTSQLIYTDQDYAIEFSDYPTVLKPSLNFTAKLKILRQDRSLLTSEDRKHPVAVTVDQYAIAPIWYQREWNINRGQSENRQSTDYIMPESGIIHIEVPLRPDTSELQIKASFQGTSEGLNVGYVFTSSTKTYIQIEKGTEELKVGIPFDLVIQSNNPLVEINYQIVSRGQIVAVGKENSTSFTLTPETSWTPVALIIVYYITDEGEVINDVASFPIQPVFENKVSLSWSKAKAMPSEKVSLTMTATEPNSLIALSIADKSVKLLGDRNDITANNVIHELKDFSERFHGAIVNSLDVFEKCHLGVLTDANLVEEAAWEYYNPSESADVDEDVILAQDLSPRFHGPSYYDDNNVPPLGEYPLFSSPNIRVFFPETWLWMNSKNGLQVDATVDVKVPDTITTWVAKAFVVSENLGLGIADSPVQLQAFQDFFVSLNLPYSVIRGEQFVLEVIIFNYLEEATEVSVTLEPSDAYDFIFESNDINATAHRRTVSVPVQDGRTVMFPVKTNHLGEINMTVIATSPTASDAITQKVLVKAEGTEKSFSQSVLLDLTGNKPSPVKETLKFTFPSNVVIGSEHVYIAVVGDILGPSINGLESLIKMPYGCGEQNMINFAPNIYILDYLTKTKQLTDEIKQKSISFMKAGYQRELLFQRPDGSFSAFGASDPSGSTWLSAFVLRCFLQARSFINIDPSVLQKTITWIFEHQKRDGEFLEPGTLLSSELKGGNKSPVTLTAYIVLAIAEYPGHQESSQFRSAINYLELKMNEGITDNYTLAIVTYALSLADISKAKQGLDTLNRRAEQHGDLRFWRTTSSKLSDGWQPSSTDIELAAYVLLAHVQQKRIAEGLPIMKWLSQQRNHLGGFSSTQDTILALQALSSIASLTLARRTDISVSVSGPNLNSPVKFKMDDMNRFLLQTEQIAVSQPLEINLSAQGVGFALFQLNIFYNVKEEVHTRRSSVPLESQEAFDLEVSVQDNTNDIHRMTVNVCTRFLGTDKSTETGMVLMQVNLLSGFAPSPDSISLNGFIKKVEKGNGIVTMYLDSLNQTQICVAVPAERDSKVAYTQEASVSVLDYYEPRRRATRSYNSDVMQSLSPCAFCEKDCDFCNNNSVGSTHHMPIAFLCFAVCLMHFLL